MPGRRHLHAAVDTPRPVVVVLQGGLQRDALLRSGRGVRLATDMRSKGFPMTNATLEGLTHTCDDPECHVSGFAATLGRLLEDRKASIEALCDEAESPPLHSMIPLGCVRASEVRAAIRDPQTPPPSAPGKGAE